MLNSFKEKQGSYIHHHYFSCELTKDVAGIPLNSFVQMYSRHFES